MNGKERILAQIEGREIDLSTDAYNDDVRR